MFVGGASFGISLALLLMAGGVWLIEYALPTEDFRVMDELLVTWLMWFFEKTFELFLISACVYMPLNFFLQDQHPVGE